MLCGRRGIAQGHKSCKRVRLRAMRRGIRRAYYRRPGSQRDAELSDVRTDCCRSPLRIEAGQGKRLDVLRQRFLPCAVYAHDLLGLGIIGVANILLGTVSSAIPIEVGSQVELRGSVGDTVKVRPGGIVASHSEFTGHHLESDSDVLYHVPPDRKSTRLNSSHSDRSRMPSSA